ncbi:hypothetical protein APR41_03550 [Salegentibacter salinarum]|uniref:Lipoprotein n=1 Tax=Salegentibacter salinarum TaxID=447422 RepID=A0A2N0TU24_9FLAO|nr:hypothetical protein [Salegentibacter salinarum]PKD18237.1 hypothetical protein APR41_03550 [Salegentibacter salinarum]SKB43222.1 hypothetical protein SAMN05660903_00723 [Salegentibacter salinarum]
MRYYASLLCLILVLVSCKNEDKNQEREPDFETEQTENKNTPEKNTEKSTSENSDYNEKETLEAPDSENNETETSSSKITPGTTYVKVDERDANCSCYCLELDMNKNTELCLSEDEMYINARYAKTGNSVNIFYVSPSNKNTNEDLPWEDFDTNNPIAVLRPGENGNMELDWKGFYIDGVLAVDYAIYGKKTLEGTYKKQ